MPTEEPQFNYIEETQKINNKIKTLFSYLETRQKQKDHCLAILSKHQKGFAPICFKQSLKFSIGD